MKMAEETAKENTVGYLVNEVARLFRKRFEDDAKTHGVTLPQWKAVAHLYHQDGMSQAALATALDTDPMTISGILRRLEKRELVRRIVDPADSRAKLVQLTPDGEALFLKARDLGMTLHAHAIADLSEDERAALLKSLKTIRDKLTQINTPTIEKETVQ
jgi:MarR family transcriptional regulator, transcriptional regulator for hemolysin